MSIFQDRLREILASRGMTSAELSRRCDLDKSALCRYMKGTVNPKPNAVKTIASALGVSPSWLLGFDDEPKLVDIPPIEKLPYCPLDLGKLTPTNRVRIKAYYQALLDTQTEIHK